MSLRLRLLLAVGAIAIVALVVADFATYSALRTSLYNQVDQELALQHPRFVGNEATGTVECPSPQSNFGNASPVGNSGAGPGLGGGNGIGGGQGFPNVFGISYISVVSQTGDVVDGLECPAYVDNHPYRPQLPSPITGFSTQSNGEQVVYFTTSSIAAGGPDFRVRALKLSGGNVLVQAQALGDQTSTLHTLFLTELAVTAAALVLALLGGWWLVRLGLRPLEDVEARPNPSRPATSTNGCPVPISRPRSVGWPEPST